MFLHGFVVRWGFSAPITSGSGLRTLPRTAGEAAGVPVEGAGPPSTVRLADRCRPEDTNGLCCIY
ncbi:hypothetical protein C7M71_000630 [Peterkaempfera bronchialis]|uniref:Uncharacterized protein n=1 Tax=Peterkaempfera bronchialis TaxID=2126346 RepID=A0A345SR45_9ACTN|nr:hypothetical protein C7M71_000630 [Peterkaempfera bronchialis]